MLCGKCLVWTSKRSYFMWGTECSDFRNGQISVVRTPPRDAINNS